LHFPRHDKKEDIINIKKEKTYLAIYGVIWHPLGSQVSHHGNRGLLLALASLYVALVLNNLLG